MRVSLVGQTNESKQHARFILDTDLATWIIRVRTYILMKRYCIRNDINNF